MTATAFEGARPETEAEPPVENGATVFVEAEYRGIGLDVLPADNHTRLVDGATLVRDAVTGSVTITKAVDWDADDDPLMFLATEEALHDFTGILQMVGRVDATYLPFRYQVMDTSSFVQVLLEASEKEDL